MTLIGLCFRSPDATLPNTISGTALRPCVPTTTIAASIFLATSMTVSTTWLLFALPAIITTWTSYGIC